MSASQTCESCTNSYQGADIILRCRLTGRPADEPCRHFQYEPGTDASERDPSRVWYCDCAGRGD